jgi:hypothetical protein
VTAEYTEQDVDEAIGLAQSMLAAGEASGKQTTAFVTSMNEPIGRKLASSSTCCYVDGQPLEHYHFLSIRDHNSTT